METKRCCTCKAVKEVCFFTVCKSQPDGLAKRCRLCNNAAHEKWRKAHPSPKPIHVGGKPGPHNGFKPNPMTAPTLHPTVKDICWAAGLYEGEGSVDKSEQCHGGRGVKATLAQKDPEILYRLRELFGGSVSRNGGRNIYWWRLSGPRAHGFLMTIYCLLSKRRQAQLREAWS